MSHLKASVIIPAYNASHFLGQCLSALNAQSVPRSQYEVIVVDDGSADETAVLARQLADQVWRQPHQGPAAARNLGASKASGDILFFTDADTEPAYNWIENMLAPFFNPGIAGVRGTYRTRQRERIARFVQLEYEEKYARTSGLQKIDFIDTYSAGYRREVFLRNGGFDESFSTASVEDQEFSFRLAKQGYHLAFAPQAVVYHRHPVSVWVYTRRKFRIGYWKVLVHKRHPDKTWRDSHTPPVQRLQVGLFLIALGALLAAPVVPLAWILAVTALMGIEMGGLPFMRFTAHRDRTVALITPGMVLVRSAALGLGLMAGVGAQILRSPSLKRALDVAGALLGLVICAPFMLLIAAAIKLDSPGSVFFTQWRAGKDGQPFRIFKFRSMVEGAEALLGTVLAQSALPGPAFKIPDDPRVTRVGKFLRRYCLDELPQFINVLRGEMSLVGPRPEETWIVQQYNSWQRRRLSVKPGMAGPMQFSRRGTLSLDERVQLELKYIENGSVWQDLCMLVTTVFAVALGRRSY